MNHASRTSYPAVSVTCAFVYGLSAAVAAGVLFRQEGSEINLETLGFLVAGPGLALVGGLLAVVRPQWGGWLYLAGGLASFALTAWLLTNLAGALAIPVLLGLVVFPMVVIAGMLLLNSSSKMHFVKPTAC